MLGKILVLLFLQITLAQAEEVVDKKRTSNVIYSYVDRDHSMQENLSHLAGIYVVSWGLYYATQPSTFRDNGSWSNFRRNFGKVVFDKDEPYWNWYMHSLSGSQLYLYYRANGYNTTSAIQMSLTSSLLFEFFIEAYTEPASIQDLVQTPVIGGILGYGIEHLSLALLNLNHPLARFAGHLLNPATLFWFYEGEVQIIPEYRGKKDVSLRAVWSF